MKQLEKQKYIVLRIRVDEGGELYRSTDFCKKLFENHIKMDNKGGFSSWLNGKVESHHQTIYNICNEALFDSGHNKNKWCYSIETTAEVYNNVRH